MSPPDSRPCDDCRAHSGIDTAIKGLQKEDLCIWDAIDKLRDRQWQILLAAGGGALFALVNLVILLLTKVPQ